jgi:hypothetical protein
MKEFTIVVLMCGSILLIWILWGMDTDFKKLKNENDVLRSEFNETFRKIVASMPRSQRLVYDAYLTLSRLSEQLYKARELRDQFAAKNDWDSVGQARQIIYGLEESYAELSKKLDSLYTEEN